MQKVGAVWKQLTADLGISAGFSPAVNELEKGGSSELMVLTDSVEVNGFVNTKREKMEKNTGQEYTKQGRRRFPQPALSDETTTFESVGADESENPAIKQC